jgi:hypothetical protein
MAANPARFIMVFFMLMLSVGINFGQHTKLSQNFNSSYLALTLLALVITGLLAHRHLFFIVLVAGLSFAINLPQEFLRQYYINSDLLLATLVAMILLPVFMKFGGFTTDTREIAR